MKKLLCVLFFLTSCASIFQKTQKENIPIQSSKPQEYIEEPEIIPEEDQEEIVISFTSKNKQFIQLVRDIASKEAKTPPILENFSLRVQTENKQEFIENLENRLDRYGKLEINENKVIVSAHKLPASGNYILISFEGKSSSKIYKDYDAILSIARRRKWRIITEWDSAENIAISIWAKSTAKTLAKGLKKKIKNFNINVEGHHISLQKKGTTLYFSLPDRDLWIEIKESLTSRFEDIGITYTDKNRKMNIITGVWKGSITALIKRILEEDLLLTKISLQLNKKTKTITIVKRKGKK